MKHDKPAIGLWCASDSPETYGDPGIGYYDTKEEAIKEAIETGVRYVGQIEATLDDKAVAVAFIRHYDQADMELLETDEWGWCEDALVHEPSKEAIQELREMVTAWVTKHKLRTREAFSVNTTIMVGKDRVMTVREAMLSAQREDDLKMVEKFLGLGLTPR